MKKRIRVLQSFYLVSLKSVLPTNFEIELPEKTAKSLHSQGLVDILSPEITEQAEEKVVRKRRTPAKKVEDEAPHTKAEE